MVRKKKLPGGPPQTKILATPVYSIARFRGFSCSKKFRRFGDNLVNFPRYQLSRLEGVSAIGPTATLL